MKASADVSTRTPTTSLRQNWRRAPLPVIVLLFALLCSVAAVAAMTGAAEIPFGRLMAALGWTQGEPSLAERDQLILWSVRFPRLVLAAIVGALLAGAGTVMQGLFRNPLADPALLGISGGAALAAAVTIVLGDKFAAALWPAIAALPIAAFFGALATTSILYRLARRDGRISIATFLLSGLAIAALANAGIGLLVFAADDRQLRDITFWMLGSLSGATWTKVAALMPSLLFVVLLAGYLARGLDVLVLGEAEAFYAGVNVERLKRLGIVLVAAATGAAVSVSGIIGFVGIVIPHLLRLAVGPTHRLLIPAAMLLGAALLLAADTLARTVVMPAELPIGIVTALVGVPFFLALLLRQRAIVGL